MNSIMIYISSIVLANLSVAHFGKESIIINSFLFIGLDLSIRDKIQDSIKTDLIPKMILIILMAGLLSYAIDSSVKFIAVASVVSFIVSSIVDFYVYHINKGEKYIVKSNVSNIFGALTDSVLFQFIAFGVIDFNLFLMQFFAKFLGGVAWSIIISLINDRQLNSN